MAETKWTLATCPIDPQKPTFLSRRAVTLPGLQGEPRSLDVTFEVISRGGEPRSITIPVRELDSPDGIYQGWTVEGAETFEVVLRMARVDSREVLTGALTRKTTGSQEGDEDTETITGLASDPPDPPEA